MYPPFGPDTPLTGTHRCRKCGSPRTVRNGCNSVRNPKYKCKQCGFGGVYEQIGPTAASRHRLIEAARREDCSVRELAARHYVSHQTAFNWIKQAREAGEL